MIPPPEKLTSSRDIASRNAPVVLPVVFIDEAPLRALAVDESGFRRLLGYEGRSASAAKSASWAFRSKFNIRTLPGGVYSIAEIKKALEATPVRRRNS